MKDENVLNTNHDQSDLDLELLKRDLQEENAFLTKLVDTIPAKMYFDQDIKKEIISGKHLAMDKVAEEIKRISSNHINLSAKSKHKRARLDPLNQKSVSEIHNKLNKKKKNRKKKGLLISSAALTRAANIEELQKKLQERIQLLQEQRKAAGKDSVSSKRLKTRLKKLKHRENQMKAKVSKSENSAAKTKNDASNTKPIFNKESNILYSKFDFSEDGHENSKKSEYTGKKTTTLLKQAKKKKEKIETLKNVDPEKAELLTEKEKWKKAIQKSEGIKVKDDPNLLKKSLKSHEKQTKKSAKAWKARNEETEKRKKARQEKRNRNIKQRKKGKIK